MFSGAHADYHRPSDTADKVDAAGLVKVATVLDEAVGYLAARPEPLTAAVGKANQPARGAASGKGRRASLGTMPDFAYTGPGVRLSGVIEASPAERAGLRGGDVIVGVDDREIGDVQSYADALRAVDPEDRITIRFLRDGEPRSVTARVVAR
jgi:S1-C subfamily serine protease